MCFLRTPLLRRHGPSRSGTPRTTEQDTTMDAERINQIGTTLSDLSARTVDLRRYL